MSLIERALSKVRGATGRVDPPVPLQRPALKVSEPRIVATPRLRFTDEMRRQFGLDTADAAPGHQGAAEYRHIKRQVVAKIQADPRDRVVLVTSALAGDGKSHIAANLARSLALEPDYSVLVVDADVVKPQLSRALRLADQPGLMNALADDSCEVDSLIVTTDIDGLSVLPAGSASENATEYFGSERMRTVLDRLKSVPNRIIVIDSLPLLQTTEACALVPLAAQVLLVVRAESTPQTAVEQALSMIGEEADVKLVLNAVVHTRLTRYFGYGYEYSSPERR